MKRLFIEVSDKELYFLWNLSVREGEIFLREDPRKPWSEKEKRDCIAAYMLFLAGEEETFFGADR